MPLFQRRRQQRERAERVARGETVSLTKRFDDKTRVGLFYATLDSVPAGITLTGSDHKTFLGVLQGVLRREWKVPTLAEEQDPAQDVQRLILEKATDAQMPDVVEAVFKVFEEARTTMTMPFFGEEEESRFRERVNEVFDDQDMAYQVVGNQVVPRDSMAMYTNVVAPALSLLHGDRRLSSVEAAFQKALTELKPNGDPTDAITDAGTALQEMLTARGATGHSLGPLLSDARSRGLLAPHDGKLVDWVSAVRSAQGDAHAVTNANPDDAWLVVHVVGALILRLEKHL